MYFNWIEELVGLLFALAAALIVFGSCYAAAKGAQVTTRDAIACTNAGGYWLDVSMTLDGQRVRCLTEKPTPIPIESEG